MGALFIDQRHRARPRANLVDKCGIHVCEDVNDGIANAEKFYRIGHTGISCLVSGTGLNGGIAYTTAVVIEKTAFFKVAINLVQRYRLRRLQHAAVVML
jgi:hypothetical protein